MKKQTCPGRLEDDPSTDDFSGIANDKIVLARGEKKVARLINRVIAGHFY